MKTSISLSLTIIILSCFLLSCNQEPTDTIKTEERDPMSYIAAYQIEIINNTNSAVTLSSVGEFCLFEKSIGLQYLHTDRFNRYTIAGGATEKIVFLWNPMVGHFFTTSGKEDWYIKSRKKYLENSIGLRSFFFRIGIDDCEYYMAGWPESLDLPQFIKSDNELANEIYGDYVLDTSKIIQYGLGYVVGEGEIRVKTYPTNVERIYSPLIIRYVNEDGQIVENDFDDAWGVCGITVLTIDAPDKIMFRTQELSLEASEFMIEWLKGKASKYLY